MAPLRQELAGPCKGISWAMYFACLKRCLAPRNHSGETETPPLLQRLAIVLRGVGKAAIA
jgi:hypothetical protein